MWNRLSQQARESRMLRTKQQMEDAFVLYTIFLGDAVKTAHALGVPADVIVDLAHEKGWDTKVGQLAELRKSDKPGDLERAINRAVNFAQAHRTRQQLERAIAMVEQWDAKTLERNLLTPILDKKTGQVVGTSFSARPLADLTAALEKAHTLTYLALGDTSQDRARRKEETNDSVLAASALHRQIAAGMAQHALEASPKERLLAEQIDQADRLSAKKSKPKPEATTPAIPPLPSPSETDEGTV
jgi:hypothetical protein